MIDIGQWPKSSTAFSQEAVHKYVHVFRGDGHDLYNNTVTMTTYSVLTKAKEKCIYSFREYWLRLH